MMQTMLQRIVKRKMADFPNAVLNFFLANKGDDIEDFLMSKKIKLQHFTPFIQEVKRATGRRILHCLRFYSSFRLYWTFAVSTGFGIEKWLKKFADDQG